MKKTKLLSAALFAFGGDDGDPAPPKINTEVKAPASKAPLSLDDDDDDGDDDHIDNPKDRKIAKLSRENNKRRLRNKDLENVVSDKDAEIAELRKELAKVPKLQQAYEALDQKRNEEQESLKRMAILSAIDKDQDAEGNPRSWYDVSMVQSLLDNEALAVDTSDFTVGGLTDQLNKIAEDKPFLVKGNDPEKKTEDKRHPSGSAPQSSATGDKRQETAATEDKMLADFPALQNLV